MRPELRRAIGLVLTALVLSALCVIAGRWQWGRYVDVRSAAAVVEANYASSPVPLAELLSSPGDVLRRDEVWRPVAIAGRYAGATALLRNRPVNGQPGFHLLAPFVIEEPGTPLDGATLVVDRGWVPLGSDSSAPAAVLAPPTGETRIVVRLRLDERASARAELAGQVHSIHVADVLVASGAAAATAIENVYGSLDSESPAPAEQPHALETPSTDLGSHQSYAYQWFTFAAGALVGFSFLAWKEIRPGGPEPTRGSGAHGPGRTGTGPASPAPGRRRRSRGPSAEDEEDALIDAQLG